MNWNQIKEYAPHFIFIMPCGWSIEKTLNDIDCILNNNELKSVIAHEVSHFYYQHNLYPNPNTAKTQLEFLNLLHLSRAAEISADRAGFLGSGNLENSLRAMLKITSGLGEDHIQFNFSNYLNQLR